MTVKEKTPMQTDISCHCGGHSVFRVGSVSHSFAGRQIVLKNVPHYVCERCGTVTYDINTDVAPYLKYAYAKEIDSIQWGVDVSPK
jgi:YgiT-type zinc finger domain-containing protein